MKRKEEMEENDPFLKRLCETLDQAEKARDAAAETLYAKTVRPSPLAGRTDILIQAAENALVDAAKKECTRVYIDFWKGTVNYSPHSVFRENIEWIRLMEAYLFEDVHNIVNKKINEFVEAEMSIILMDFEKDWDTKHHNITMQRVNNSYLYVFTWNKQKN